MQPPPDRPSLKDLSLPPPFDESKKRPEPLDSRGQLPPPGTGPVSLPRSEGRAPRVMVADDSAAFLEALQNILAGSSSEPDKIMELRTWCPAPGTPQLAEYIEKLLDDGWRPDVVVIDMNMGEGGKPGVQYLQELRKKPGCAAIPVILATATSFADAEKGKFVDLTMEKRKARRWVPEAREQAAESILYNKTGERHFLLRILENQEDWKRAARRRAWAALLAQIAPALDGATVSRKDVSETLVQYAVTELDVDFAFVRWRTSQDSYELVAHASATAKDYIANDGSEQEIVLDDMPAMRTVMLEKRDPVRVDVLQKDKCGKFADRLTDHRFLGVGLVLGDTPIGFITLVRQPEKEIFDDIDEQNLSVLARLMASALGRDARMRDRQTSLVEFAQQIAHATRSKNVCTHLGTMLHDELHWNNNAESKTSVRLLPFGTGDLKREYLNGLKARECRINIADSQSVYAYCVRENEAMRIGDVTAPEYKEKFIPTTAAAIHSELCVPIPIGNSAIGAVNLEHTSKFFYTELDEDFVKAAAGLAGYGIDRIRSIRFLNGMTWFTYQFLSHDTRALQQSLHELLYDFCNYSVLAELKIIPDGPWQVEHVVCKLEGSDERVTKENLEKIYHSYWEQTWIRKLWKEEQWKNEWASYTDQKDFLPVISGKTEVTQRADALLWLRRGNNPPHRALMLLWYLPPPMNDERIRLLGSMARLFSTLDDQQQKIQEMIEEKLIGEQAAQMGHILQHFRHRVGNLTGGLRTHFEGIQRAIASGNTDARNKSLSRLDEAINELAHTFQKERPLIKKSEFTRVPLKNLIQSVLDTPGLDQRLADIAISLDLPEEIELTTDKDIASLVFYSLLENAADALAHIEKKRIHIFLVHADKHHLIVAIEDNGSGVSPDMRPRLFTWGGTSKSSGLGSALAFARTRMRTVLHGDLAFLESKQPEQGARFDVTFPLHPREGDMV